MKERKFIFLILFSIFSFSSAIYCNKDCCTFWQSLKQKWKNAVSWINQKFQKVFTSKEEKKSIKCPKAVSYTINNSYSTEQKNYKRILKNKTKKN